MSGDDSGSSDRTDPGRDRPGTDGSRGDPADDSAERTSDDSRGPGNGPDRGSNDPGGRPSSQPPRTGQGEYGEGDSEDRRASGPPRAPPRRRPAADRPEDRGFVGWIRRFRTAQSGPLMVVREVLSSVLMVAAVGLILFAISGVWPPMVAVQSGSMEPHMHRGDLVFVVDEPRFADDVAIEDTGVAPHAVAEGDGYEKFGNYGDVIIYRPDGSSFPDPIIHRAMFWVDEGENWYDEADPDYLHASSCAELRNCPAPNSGFITKGDNNPRYDQASDMSRPVKPEWITGKAMVRIPALGYIRLFFADLARTAAFGVGALVLGSGLGGRRSVV